MKKMLMAVFLVLIVAVVVVAFWPVSGGESLFTLFLVGPWEKSCSRSSRPTVVRWPSCITGTNMALAGRRNRPRLWNAGRGSNCCGTARLFLIRAMKT